MKPIIMIIFLLFLSIFFGNGQDTCTLAQSSNDRGPERIVIIKGKATIINHPELGETPATTETLIFQKVGCPSCYVATRVDDEGNYKILVGDGKYKIIVRNPSSPEFDMLTREQERYIDTETLEAKKYSKQVFDFNIKIRLPK
jgi:hypothetical protein